ncbi:MAG: hypothetical protein ACAH22_14365 [Tardiphaga sp.]
MAEREFQTKLFFSAYSAVIEEYRAARRLHGDALERAIGHVICVFESIADRHDSANVAWALEHAFASFYKAVRNLGQPLSDEQRDGLFRATAIARLGVEIHTSGHERDDLVEGLGAVQKLTVHHGRRSDASDCLQPSEIADLWSWTKTAYKTAGNIVERCDRAERERVRMAPLIDSVKSRRGRAA